MITSLFDKGVTRCLVGTRGLLAGVATRSGTTAETRPWGLVIDLVLAGDNAVVIGVYCKNGHFDDPSYPIILDTVLALIDEPVVYEPGQTLADEYADINR